jgi:hypothetical protein
LLDTTHGDIASIPWHLTVADFSGYVCWHEGIDIAVVNEDLRIVSSRLQKVTVLNMLHSEELGSDILSNLTSVRQLEMIKMSVSGMDDIFKFVHDIPELEALSMEDISWNSCEPITRDHTQLSRRPSFAMGTVRLEGAAFTDVTNWLLHLRPMPAIHTFHCDAYDPATSQNRDALLQTVGPTIRSLHLYFNNRPNGLEGRS